MFNPYSSGYSPYGYGGGFSGVSPVPQGVFQQLGGALGEIGQQAANWLPAIQQQQTQYWQNQGQMALQAYQLAESLDPNAPADRRRQRAVQLQDALSKNPLYRGFQIPTVQVESQPSVMGAVSPQQPPPGSPFAAPGTPATPAPQRTVPALPPSGGPYGGSWVPSLGPQSPQIPSQVPSTAGLPAPTDERRTLQAATSPPPEYRPMPPPATTAVGEAVTPTTPPAPYQAPTYGREIAVGPQPLGARTTRELFGRNPALLNQMTQVAGTTDILDQPWDEVQRVFPATGVLAAAGAGNAADFFRQHGIAMAPDEEQRLAAIPMTNFVKNGVLDVAALETFANNFTTKSIDTAIRLAQLDISKARALTEKQKADYQEKKQAYDDYAYRYVAAKQAGDTDKISRLNALAANQGLTPDIVQVKGDELFNKLETNRLVPVRGLSGTWYNVPQREALSSEFKAAQLANQSANIDFRKEEIDMAKQRLGMSEQRLQMAVGQALQKGPTLSPEEKQALTTAGQILSGTFQGAGAGAKQAAINRAVVVMRKLGIDVKPSDFTGGGAAGTPTGPTGGQQIINFLGKLIQGIRNMAGQGTPPAESAPSPTPGPAPAPPPTPQSQGGWLPGSGAAYQGWIKSGRKPIPAALWNQLTPDEQRQLNIAGVTHE